MKIKKSKNQKKRTAITLLLIIVVGLAAYATYAYYNSLWPFTKPTETKLTQEQQASNDSDSQNRQQKDDQSATSKSDDVDTTKTTDQIPVSTSASITITSLTQSDDGIVRYSATPSDTSRGTCSATFTSDLGKPVVKNSSVSNGACSAEISALEFDAPGTWKLTLRYYLDNTQAVAEKSLEVR